MVVSFKAASGIRSAEEAMTYLKLAESVMGSTWVNDDHFRFGTSGLLDSLAGKITEKEGVAKGPEKKGTTKDTKNTKKSFSFPL